MISTINDIMRMLFYVCTTISIIISVIIIIMWIMYEYEERNGGATDD